MSYWRTHLDHACELSIEPNPRLRWRFLRNAIITCIFLSLIIIDSSDEIRSLVRGLDVIIEDKGYFISFCSSLKPNNIGED